LATKSNEVHEGRVCDNQPLILSEAKDLAGASLTQQQLESRPLAILARRISFAWLGMADLDVHIIAFLCIFFFDCWLHAAAL